MKCTAKRTVQPKVTDPAIYPIVHCVHTDPKVELRGAEQSRGRLLLQYELKTGMHIYVQLSIHIFTHHSQVMKKSIFLEPESKPSNENSTLKHI